MSKPDYIQFIVIDLFCGAGGTTLGFEQAESDYDDMYRFLKSYGITPPKDRETFFRISKVIACVNHDHLAITSHWKNHPDVKHFEEALYNICDIKMRMLKVPELKKIQGFPEDYVLLGNQTDQKKFIGNAVHPLVPKFWIQSFSKRLAA